MSNGIVEKRIDKLRAEYLKNRHNDGWHAHQDCHGKAALRGVNPRLALDLETFTDHIGQVIQNRSVRFMSASRTGMPNFCSSKSWRNSLAKGSEVSLEIISRAVVKA